MCSARSSDISRGVPLDQPLPKATLLTARKLAPTAQTEFASTDAAYENLPDAEKQAIESLRVLHKLESAMQPVFEQMSEEDLARWREMSCAMIHPLVWTPPVASRCWLARTLIVSLTSRSRTAVYCCCACRNGQLNRILVSRSVERRRPRDLGQPGHHASSRTL